MNYIKEKFFSFFKKNNQDKIREYNTNNFLHIFTVLKKSIIDIKTNNYLYYFLTILAFFILNAFFSGITADYITQNSLQSNQIEHSNSLLMIILQCGFAILFSCILFIIPNSIYFFEEKLTNVQKIKKSINILNFLPHIFFSFILTISFLYFLVNIFNVNLTLEELQALQNNTTNIEDNKNAFYVISLFILFIPFVIYLMHLGYLNNKFLNHSFFKSYILSFKAIISNFIYSMINVLTFIILFILYLIISVALSNLNENIQFIFNIFSLSFYGLLLKNFYTSLFSIQVEIVDNSAISKIKEKLKKN